MTGLRGIRDDSNLHEWLNDYIWPAEAGFTPDMTTRAVKEAMIEMLQSGTTTFNDMYNPNGVDIDQIYQAVKDSKMRCYFSPTLFSSEAETTDETISRTRFIIEKILEYKNPNFKVMVAPHSPYSCNQDLLQASLEVAKELAIPIHIHVAETKEESGIILKRYGKRPLAVSRRIGLLRSSFCLCSWGRTKRERKLNAWQPLKCLLRTILSATSNWHQELLQLSNSKKQEWQ